MTTFILPLSEGDRLDITDLEAALARLPKEAKDRTIVVVVEDAKGLHYDVREVELVPDEDTADFTLVLRAGTTA